MRHGSRQSTKTDCWSMKLQMRSSVHRWFFGCHEFVSTIIFERRAALQLGVSTYKWIPKHAQVWSSILCPHHRLCISKKHGGPQVGYLPKSANRMTAGICFGTFCSCAFMPSSSSSSTTITTSCNHCEPPTIINQHDQANQPGTKMSHIDSLIRVHPSSPLSSSLVTLWLPQVMPYWKPS